MSMTVLASEQYSEQCRDAETACPDPGPEEGAADLLQMRRKGSAMGSAMHKITKARVISVLRMNVRVIIRTVRIFLGSDIRVYAGYATLRLLISIFPLFMLIIALLNILPGYSPSDFVDFLFSMLPDLPEVKGFVLGVLLNLRYQSSTMMVSLTALAAIWSASSGVSAVQKGLKKIDPIWEEGKGVQEKLLSLLTTVVMIVTFPLLLLLNVLGEASKVFLENILDTLGLPTYLTEITKFIKASGIIAMVISAVVVMLIFAFLPGGRRSLRQQLPGAVLTSIGWIVFTFLFTKFMPVFWKSSVYGSLASAFLIMLWLEFSIIILFVGASLNKAITEVMAGKAGDDLDRILQSIKEQKQKMENPNNAELQQKEEDRDNAELQQKEEDRDNAELQQKEEDRDNAGLQQKEVNPDNTDLKQGGEKEC